LGQTVVAFTGTVSSGQFVGYSVTAVATFAAPNLIACISPGGVTESNGTFTTTFLETKDRTTGTFTGPTGQAILAAISPGRPISREITEAGRHVFDHRYRSGRTVQQPCRADLPAPAPATG
jgi:hypothetical protein